MSWYKHIRVIFRYLKNLGTNPVTHTKPLCKYSESSNIESKKKGQFGKDRFISLNHWFYFFNLKTQNQGEEEGN